MKKIAIGDKISPFVNSVYLSSGHQSGFALAVATMGFGIQVYCDFSGYSDMAIGTAQILGFRLTRNFDTPFFSRSTPEFWRRWHISLMSWFTTYVYTPLAVRSHRILGKSLPIVIVFALVGFWHGANWTFVVFGALNGLYCVFSLWTKGLRERTVRLLGLDPESSFLAPFQITTVFLLFSFSLIFFRASSLHQSFSIIGRLVNGWTTEQLVQDIGAMMDLMALPPLFFGCFWALVLAVFALERQSGEQPVWFRVQRQPRPVRWACYYLVCAVLLVFGVTTPTAFIYFQF
jgi:D-alanyl-lipoteichoic acid acyltransferase DltB (MBOAT superfamily)